MYTHTSKCVHTYIQTHTPTDFLNDIDTQIVLSQTLTLYNTHQTFTHSNTLHYTTDSHTHTHTHTCTPVHASLHLLQAHTNINKNTHKVRDKYKHTHHHTHTKQPHT